MGKRRPSDFVMRADLLLRPRAISREKRIGERITPQPNGCWTYGDDPDVYGRHRFVWKTLRGPIPPGFHLHHVCETPACCNPDHLQMLTPLEHKQAHKALRQARKE